MSWRSTLGSVIEPDGEVFADGHEVGMTREVRGAILERYYDEGGPDVLGLPTSGERPTAVRELSPYGDREITFESAVIVLDSRSGETTLIQRQEDSAEA